MRSRIIRIVLALAIVGWLVVHAGLDEIVGQMRHALPLPVALAFAAVGADTLLRTLNWRQLLRAVQPRVIVHFWRLFAIYLSAALVGTFVPSSAGTDLLRSGMSQQSFGGHFVTNAAAVLLQNALSLVVASLLGLVGFAALWQAGVLPKSLALVPVALLGIAVGAPLAYAALRYRRDVFVALARKLGRRWYRLRRSLRRLFRSTLLLEKSHLKLGRVLLVAAAALGFQSLGYALAGWALDVRLPAAAWLVLPSVLSVTGLLPATFLGFGATQAASSYVLVALGVPLPDAVALATLATLVSLSFRAVSGGAAMVFWPSRPG
jgi:uncharacterized membrane protein YbhN (UPF0104 family)